MKKMFSAYAMGLASDSKKQKRLIISAVVFLVVFVSLAKFAQNAEAGKGDVILRGGAETAAQGGSAAAAEGDAASIAQGSEGLPTDGAADSGIAAGGAQGSGSVSAGGAAESAAAADGQAAAVFVDVNGAVQSPGVIALPAGSRVNDAIIAAGGLTDNADVTMLNRASVLADGDRVYVASADEVQAGAVPPSAGMIGAGSSAGSSGSAAASGAGSVAAPAVPGLVNINTADSDTLQTLNGVGPATAQKILDYRNANGGFGRVEDLMNVSGIGQKTFDKLKANITV
ncbi:MAG: ComEA family DNA-binding protein [Clostridiales Family XIII bacterium]|nr:ComEA family DNA-binding protein [Clostridiales Family XIII bacterium]